jgi:hypothetical protein
MFDIATFLQVRYDHYQTSKYTMCGSSIPAQVSVFKWNTDEQRDGRRDQGLDGPAHIGAGARYSWQDNGGFETHHQPMRRDVFLTEMDKVAPWVELCAMIEPLYPQGARRRRPSPGGPGMDAAHPLPTAVGCTGRFAFECRLQVFPGTKTRRRQDVADAALKRFYPSPG